MKYRIVETSAPEYNDSRRSANFTYRRQTYSACLRGGWLCVNAVFDDGRMKGVGGHSNVTYRVEAARALAIEKPRGLLAAALAAVAHSAAS